MCFLNILFKHPLNMNVFEKIAVFYSYPNSYGWSKAVGSKQIVINLSRKFSLFLLPE
ncbi:hypothetical protein GCM10007354_09650 [Acinetobacter courvalinii]|uniref:Uncharacterized protein n=1 Tax=Acinetobacter courvalinii TaxID=280147 RepID=A0ABD0A5F3_9GAMM|nr:hypothetical protein GCM10007354_09650 [Acinetobacter courvalinii]